jgi:hypothetical protein
LPVPLFLLSCSAPARKDTSSSIDASKASAHARIPGVYASFSFGNCNATESCPVTFAKAVGADLGPTGKGPAPNPRATMKNPDPVWLPAWGRLPEGDAGAHYTFAALTLAAVERSWSVACDAAYREHKKRMDERLAALDRAVAEKNRDPNPYDRLRGILALEPEKPSKDGLGEFVRGSDALRHAWELAVFEAFEATGRTFVYALDRRAPSDALLAVMRPRQPEAFERDAFCLDAQKAGAPNLAPMPDTSAWDADVRAMVKRAVSPDRASEITRRRAEITAQVKLKFAKVKVDRPQPPPGVREMSTGAIQSFARDGRKATTTYVAAREERAGSKLVKIDETVVATFPDWPSGVLLEPGDAVTFYGFEVRTKDTVIRSTPELEHLSRQTSVEAKHVVSVRAKGTVKKTL